MEHKTIPIALLDGHKRNYNAHPPEQIAMLKESFARFQGQVRSIVVYPEPNGRYTILAGHGVVEAAREAGIVQIACDVTPHEWDATMRESYLIADNLHAQNSEPDQELLAQLLQEQQDAGYDLASLGSDDESLRQLLESLGNHYLDNDSSEEEDEDLLDISKESQAVETISKLRFGKYEVPLTQDEFKDLESKLKRYSDDMGSYHGFVRTLL